MKLFGENEPRRIEYINRPELVIGLVGAVGIRWEPVINILKDELARVDYQTLNIRLSHLLEEIFGTNERAKENRYKRLDRLMTQGDTLRETLQHPDAVALLSVAAIHRAREAVNVHRVELAGNAKDAGKTPGDKLDRNQDTKIPDFGPSQERDRALLKLDINQEDYASVPLAGCAYILRSLKTPAEENILRKIYGRAFFLIAAYSSHDARIEDLSDRIADSHNDSDSTRYRKLAEKLVDRDEKDRDKTFGQNVRDTFPKADLFLNADDPVNLRDSLRRFIEALFGFQFHTPTRDEYGMFHAVAASRRSADLSRQVGAAITTSEGNVVAVGCNEVPKAGGGLYWPGDPGDRRDYRLEKDVSHDVKDVIVREAIAKLRAAAEAAIQQKPQECSDQAVQQAVQCKITEIFDELERKQRESLRGARITGLLEFGRTVHAEMAALADAALRGVSVRQGIMYVTTFPCHMCARHIVASGLKRVVYIEPYPKSMVRKLYPDSISVDDGVEAGTVRFEPFLGFSPRIYLRFFEEPEYPKREDDKGRVVAWDKGTIRCRIMRYVASYLFIELRAVRHMANELEEKTNRLNEARRENCWQNLAEAQPLHGNKTIDNWLRERKSKIEEDVEKSFPRWMKMAILAHRYF
jgi:cytidine deaminase